MNDGLIERGKGEGTDEWETPPWLFKALDSEFGFTFDAAASETNHLCKEWSGDILTKRPYLHDRVFCNPPYSNVQLFVEAALARPLLWVFVLPAFVDKAWYRLLFESPRVTFRPFRRRVAFLLGGAPAASPFFGTTLAIVRPI